MGFIWCHYHNYHELEKGYSANLDVNLIKVQILCDQLWKGMFYMVKKIAILNTSNNLNMDD
jgi:hypothetical protein